MTESLIRLKQIRVNDYTDSDQGDPNIAVNPATRGFQVVWESDGQDGDGLGVFGRDYSALGGRLGAEFQINTVALGDQENPDVAFNDDGNGAWVWETNAVWKVTVDRDTTPFAEDVAENVRTRSKTFGFESDDGFYYNEERVRYGRFDPAQEGQAGLDPRVIALGGDQFATGYLVQELFRNSSSYTVDEFTAYIPSVVPNNGQWSRNFAEDDQQFRNQTSYGDIAQIAEDMLLVVSAKTSDTAGSDGVIQFQYFERVDEDDRGLAFPLGERIEVSDSGLSGSADHPRVAVLDSGGFALTWTETADDGDADVYVKVYDADGDARSPAVRAHAASGAEQSGSEIAALADGGFVITYTDASGRDGDGTAIIAQRFDGDGVRLGQGTVVNSTAAGDQDDSAVAVLPSGFIVAAWDSASGDGDGSAVLAQGLAPAPYGAGVAQFLAGTSAGERFVVGGGDDTVEAGGGRDLIGGGAGNDRIYGQEGNDGMAGGAGNDRLFGGQGDDTLIGNGGVDAFVYDAGRDEVRDFEDNRDILAFDGALHESGRLNRSKLEAVSDQIGADLVFDFGGGNVLTVKNTDFDAVANDLFFF